jgi:uncharacterized protein involved in exopolysaccharide biosynthesis
MIENSSSFTLTDVADVIKRRFKTIAGFVAVVIAATTLLVFLLPQYYSASATGIAANPALADKARLFNPNIEGLYSSFGSSDDLDRLYGIARLDTVYATLVDRFDLITYYKIKGPAPAKARRSAILKLQNDITVEKNELYQLTIIVWNKDPQLAANIANTMVALVEEKVQVIWQAGYTKTLQQFDTAINNLQQAYNNPGIQAAPSNNNMAGNTNNDLLISERAAIPDQIKEYRRLQNEFRVAQANSTPALIVLEQATIAPKPAKPKKLATILAALLLSSFFGVLAALIYDRKSTAGHV